MFEQDEMMSLVAAIGVAGFILRNRRTLAQVESSVLLIVSCCLLLASLALSVLEVLFWSELLDVLQHVAASVSAVVLAVWCYLTFARSERASA